MSQQHINCVSGMNLLRQSYVLPHCYLNQSLYTCAMPSSLTATTGVYQGSHRTTFTSPPPTTTTPVVFIRVATGVPSPHHTPLPSCITTTPGVYQGSHRSTFTPPPPHPCITTTPGVYQGSHRTTFTSPPTTTTPVVFIRVATGVPSPLPSPHTHTTTTSGVYQGSHRSTFTPPHPPPLLHYYNTRCLSG